MKIIKEGSLPEKVVNFSCLCCTTEFECTLEECAKSMISGCATRTVCYYRCPVCDNNCELIYDPQEEEGKSEELLHVNTEDKIELSRQLIEKAGEVNKVLKQAKKDELIVEIYLNEVHLMGTYAEYDQLYPKLTQLITYGNTSDGVNVKGCVDKTELGRLTLIKLTNKIEEFNELVSKSHARGLEVRYHCTNPLKIDITETITFSL